MRNVLLRGALAGAVAGLLTSLFHLLLTEPVLDRAIALEGASDGPVSRETQKYLGGPAGQVLFGISIGLLFALSYRVLPSTATAWRKAAGLALASWLVIALIPQLRYPANPPGVGDPETISTRTSSYLLTYAVGLVVVSGAYAALRALHRRGWAEPARQTLVVAAALIVIGAAYALLPDSGDAVDAPASIVWDFRIRALGGLTLFFAVLGAAFGGLTLRAQQRQRAEPAPVTPVML
jgi:predicted cobalt transporter CbtA